MTVTEISVIFNTFFVFSEFHYLQQIYVFTLFYTVFTPFFIEYNSFSIHFEISDRTHLLRHRINS